MRTSTKVAAAAVASVMVLGLGGCASCDRMGKSISSDMGGGLHRTVTLYDYNGQKIQEWSGKFDVTEDDQEVSFDLDGKRTIVQGGIVVVQED